MASIQKSYNWTIEQCAADNVGYSQTYRNQQTVNGITYYDCSSLMWYALVNGDFDIISKYGNVPFTTRNMQTILKGLGFKEYNASVTWKAGDILWKSGHTEMAFDSTRSMGAHTSTVPLADQVSINANDSRNNGWKYLYRYEDGTVKNEWLSGNRYLSIGEMQNNAAIVFDYLLGKGWSVEAVSGLLGNVQKESTINPAIWQDLTVNPSMGYGLVQWTPSTNITSWLTENGYDLDDGTAQLLWIDTETVPTGQWIETDNFPISFEEFKHSKDTPENLSYAFMYNFERPKDKEQPERKVNARYWYDWYNNLYVPPDNPPSTGGEWSASMPIWFYIPRKYF